MDEQPLTIMWNHETGQFEKYDDTYDITIHCKNEEEAARVSNLMLIASQIGGVLWHPASEIPTLHHVVEDSDGERFESDISYPLLTLTPDGMIHSEIRYSKEPLYSGWVDFEGGGRIDDVTHWMLQSALLLSQKEVPRK